ncbi:hypothetical protein CSKR_106322 [Clonorchis sinensis]|uniref:Uncharacterized protein n=1 Tax=Clonorchis sinensis TaxID=79923 RepID=A0A3R7DGG4_CLOSI|nr:hypothetical protein CSKR_106322 [Clonorchis sinensis]
MRRPGAAHSVAWKHHKREIQLGFSSLISSEVSRVCKHYEIVDTRTGLKYSPKHNCESSEVRSFAYQFDFHGRPNRISSSQWAPQLNVLCQTVSCFSWCDKPAQFPTFRQPYILLEPKLDTDFHKYSHLHTNLVFTGGPTESLVYDVRL